MALLALVFQMSVLQIGTTMPSLQLLSMHYLAQSVHIVFELTNFQNFFPGKLEIINFSNGSQSL
jgi:hypothetical protein